MESGARQVANVVNALGVFPKAEELVSIDASFLLVKKKRGSKAIHAFKEIVLSQYFGCLGVLNGIKDFTDIETVDLAKEVPVEGGKGIAILPLTAPVGFGERLGACRSRRPIQLRIFPGQERPEEGERPWIEAGGSAGAQPAQPLDEISGEPVVTEVRRIAVLSPEDTSEESPQVGEARKALPGLLPGKKRGHQVKASPAGVVDQWLEVKIAKDKEVGGNPKRLVPPFSETVVLEKEVIHVEDLLFPFLLDAVKCASAKPKTVGKAEQLPVERRERKSKLPPAPGFGLGQGLGADGRRVTIRLVPVASEIDRLFNMGKMLRGEFFHGDGLRGKDGGEFTGATGKGKSVSLCQRSAKRGRLVEAFAFFYSSL
jgi:hypothetical protein